MSRKTVYMGYPYHSEQGKQEKGKINDQYFNKNTLNFNFQERRRNCDLNHSVTSLSNWQN